MEVAREITARRVALEVVDDADGRGIDGVEVHDARIHRVGSRADHPRRLSRFRPYGKIGTGASLFYIQKSSKREALGRGLELRDSWKFLATWGGGFKYFATDELAFTFDVKDHLSGVPSYGLPSSARKVNGQYQPGVSSTGVMHNWQLNFGVAVQWDNW